MEEAPPPAGLNLSLDELIGAARRKESRGSGGGGGRGRGERRSGGGGGNRNERMPRHEDGDGGHGPARRRGSVLDRLGPPIGGGGGGSGFGGFGGGGGGFGGRGFGGGRGRGRGPRPPPAEEAPRAPPGPHKAVRYARLRCATLHVPSDAPPATAQHESLSRGEDGSAVLSYDGYPVVSAAPSGELTLDSGGSAEVQPSIEEALALFGLKLSASPADATAWSVSDGRAFLRRYEDGMIVPCLSQPGMRRALALAAAHGDDDAAAELRAMGGLNGGASGAGFGGGRGRGGGYGFGGRGRGRGPPRYAPY